MDREIEIETNQRGVVFSRVRQFQMLLDFFVRQTGSSLCGIEQGSTNLGLDKGHRS
jgi:hypothetical protein